ncbi:hypothetical protein DNTS_011372 [Danionella cerebrum]|uniref:Sedoheptulokinase n=1 Tax=Danionella cerebrum TaxID=2873325 RepID=A0A553QWV4_9TELE|nr:hypothetical protein DNTS_011372 [Danionella translucida]
MATPSSVSEWFVLGVDLGSTSVKVALLNAQSGSVTDSKSFPTNSDLTCSSHTQAKEQDPVLIMAALDQCMEALPRSKLKDVKCIGVCGQMHGIMLWKSKSGCEWQSLDDTMRFVPRDVSQLITWQDGRCGAEFLSSLPKPDSHQCVATGFGCATVFWYMNHSPEFLSGYSSAGTIQDYLVSMLCDLDKCVMSGQNAASWGYFNTSTSQWNTQILRDAGFPLHLLPVVVDSGAMAGKTSSEWFGIPAHTPVGAALGDFQCSVYSCMMDHRDAVLNMSTSAQLTFSMPAEFTPPSSPDPLCPVAYFPYFHDSYLAVAASLNGGNVLATFVRMLDSWMKEFGLEVSESSIYSQLIQSALAQSDSSLTVTCTLLGERHDPNTSASVSQISPSNLSLGHVTRAVCRGVIENIATMMPAQKLRAAGVQRIIGSGSALSCNPVLQQEVERIFQFPIVYGKSVDSAVGVAMVFSDQTQENFDWCWETKRGIRMSKSKSSSISSFSLEADDQSMDESSKAKPKKSCLKDKMPMDSNYLDDVVEPSCTIKFNLHFDKGIRKVKEEPSQHETERFTIKRLFEAVSSGEVSKLQGLHMYLHKNMKRLTDSQYKSNGKTALLKALLNLKQGENETIEHLLEIAEKMGHLKEFINAAYTDSYYKGQTALHVAIERRSMKFVQMLVQKGADVHARACGKFFQPNQEMCFYFGELPMSLAACTNQPDIVDFLLDNPYQPVDVKQRDSHGNTVLHALVSIADNSPENTEFVIAIYDHILIKADQLHLKIKLEDIENNEGLTPIALAAKKGKLELFKHIVQRELRGYRHLSRKITEWAYGPVCSSLYDLSSLDSYEKNSALETIVYGSQIPNRLQMLNIEPLNRLITEKWNRFAHRMFLFNFIAYVAYLVVFTSSAFYLETENRNQSRPPFRYTQNWNGFLVMTGHIITTTGAFYFFIRGLIDMLRKRPRFQSLVIDGYTDQLFFLQAVLFLTSALLYCFSRDEYLAFLVLCLALSWINLLYFSRGSKNLGIYSVMIQKESIQSRSGASRRQNVYPLTTPHSHKTRFTMTSETEYEPCKKPTYKNIYFTTLELFKFTIGMGDLEFTDHYKYKEVFYFLLIVYIVMTYILLLNMLIALMNQRVEDLSVESTNIWKLQRAITTLDMEWILPECLKRKLRSGEEKDLSGGREPDRRWCFSVEEVNWTQWNRKVGIINEDPGKCKEESSPTNVQKEPSRRGLLQTFSKRKTQRPPRREEQELTVLNPVSSMV